MFYDEFYYSTDLNPFPFWKSTFVFEKDDGDDKGGGGAKDDNKDDDKGGKKDDAPETRSVKVDGVEKLVTFAEALEGYSKSAGADEKFRSAAEKLKEVDDLKEKGVEASKIVKTFGKLFKSGEYTKTDIREFGEMVGMEEGEMEKMFSDDLKKAGKTEGDDKAPFRKLKIEDLDDDMQETLKQAKASQVVEAEKKIVDMVNLAVDKDEYFGTILKKTDEKQRDDRKAAIEEMVKKDVYRRILQSPSTKEQFGDQMIQGSIQEIRANVKRFGILDKASKQPPSSLLAGLGLSGELQTKIQTDEEIKRVPVTDDNYLDTLVARLAQMMKVK